MKRGERNPNCTFSGAETDKNAPRIKVSVKLVIINKGVRFCLVVSRISRARILSRGKNPGLGGKFPGFFRKLRRRLPRVLLRIYRKFMARIRGSVISSMA
jgi:hypothetical protein